MTWLRRNAWLVILIALVVVGEIVAVLIAGTECRATSTPCGPIILGRVAIGIVVVAVALIGRAGEAWASRRDRANTAREHLGELLKTDVQSIFQEQHQPNIRANIMLIERDRLRVFASHNMADEREKQSLEFRKGAGACSVAWELASTKPSSERWRPVYAPDLQGTDVLKWGLTPAQISITKDIRWIISAPILNQDSLPIGVLNIDALGDTPGPTKIAKAAFATDEKLFTAVASAASKYARELTTFRIV
ncbi:MAG: hypothetical protein M1389_09345 [Chloroflexi bacterium]|nr:hypothetical protein [Chloroflexota bacterium]